MISWIVGPSGSGKTYLAKALVEKYGGVLIDADSIRRVWEPQLGWSKEDRITNNIQIARLARMLEDQGHNVVVATICPEYCREDVTRIARPKFIQIGDTA